MAGQSKSRKLREMLAEKANWLLEEIGAGKTIYELATELAEHQVWPAQIDKFLRLTPEFRDRYRLALVNQAALNVITKAAGKKTGRPRKGEKPKSNAEIVAEHEDVILMALFDGETVLHIADQLMVRRADIAKHFKATEERTALYEDAMREGGHAMAEMAVAVAEEPALDLVDAKRNELRVNSKQWLAAKRNSKYDNKQQVDLKGQLTTSVSIDIATD